MRIPRTLILTGLCYQVTVTGPQGDPGNGIPAALHGWQAENIWHINVDPPPFLSHFSVCLNEPLICAIFHFPKMSLSVFSVCLSIYIYLYIDIYRYSIYIYIVYIYICLSTFLFVCHLFIHLWLCPYISISVCLCVWTIDSPVNTSTHYQLFWAINSVQWMCLFLLWDVRGCLCQLSVC